MSSVFRRRRITNLSPLWVKALAESGNAVSHFTLAHLELVARLPVDTQEKLIKGKNEYTFRGFGGALCISVKDLEKQIGDYLHKLSAASWAKDSCAGCQKRSDAVGELDLWNWPGKGKATDHAVCLDPNCWKKLQAQWVDFRVGQLREEHPELVVVVERSDKRFPAAVSYYNVTEVKKSTKGAVPAIWVQGDAPGKFGYIEKPAKSASPAAAAEMKPQTPEEEAEAKKAEALATLETKRWDFIADKVIAVLVKFPASKLQPKQISALATIFGTEERLGWGRTPGSWRRAKQLMQESIDKVDAQLFDQVRPVLLQRLDIQMREVSDRDEVKGLTEFFEIDLAALIEEAKKQPGLGDPDAKSATAKPSKKAKNGKAK